MEHQEHKKRTMTAAHTPSTVTHSEGPRFPLGRTLITPGAQAQLDPADMSLGLERHARGDWGECSEADQKENEFSLTRNLRLMSVYHDRNGTKFWIITEADRSATTVLLPEDY